MQHSRPFCKKSMAEMNTACREVLQSGDSDGVCMLRDASQPVIQLCLVGCTVLQYDCELMIDTDEDAFYRKPAVRWLYMAQLNVRVTSPNTASLQTSTARTLKLWTTSPVKTATFTVSDQYILCQIFIVQSRGTITLLDISHHLTRHHM